MVLALKRQKSHFQQSLDLPNHFVTPCTQMLSQRFPRNILPTVTIRSPTFRPSSTGQKPLVPGPRRIARRANSLSTCHLKISRCRSSESCSRRRTAVTCESPGLTAACARHLESPQRASHGELHNFFGILSLWLRRGDTEAESN